VASESGQEYNPETAMDLRRKDFLFSAAGHVFRYTLRIPDYILARLGGEVMDKLYIHMNGHASTVVTDAIHGGYFHTDQGRAVMRTDVGTHLRNYIWERFSIAQEAAGNECWQTAPTLQKVRTI